LEGEGGGRVHELARQVAIAGDVVGELGRPNPPADQTAEADHFRSQRDGRQ
jgi:hypothetical protein